jgi:DNA-binding response OmpR family regulator
LSFTVAGSITDLHPAASQSYDAIVMNLHIPGTDGLGLCRRLRREARKAYTVLIVIERDTPDDKLIGLEAGAVGYMVKPFKVRELDARL